MTKDGSSNSDARHDSAELDDTASPFDPSVAARLLPLLTAQAPDHAFILLDAHSRIVGWLGAAADIFGYSDAEVAGRTLDFLFTDEDRAQGLPQHEREVAVTSGRSEDDRWHLRKDGAWIWVMGSLMALREDGRLAGFAKVISDRTGRFSQSETMKNRLDAAHRSLQAKDVFFARLAHEVRNALSPMMSVVNLLERSPEGEGVKLSLAVVRREIAQLQRLMRDLSDVARSGVGKLQLLKEEFNLGVDLTEIAESLRPQALAKQQHLVSMVPPVPVLIHADRQRVHQIVFNLVHNAIKYTPPGGHIWTQCTVEGDYAVIKVEDTGVGIAPDLLPLIFELFTQENPSQSEGGFGVGLSLVKDLVDAHDGFVEVACDGKGKGATFAVRLPIGSGD